MSIEHHIDDATLMSFAAGTLSEPLAAVIACHLDMCTTCRQTLADYDLMGGLLLETVAGDTSPHMRPIPKLAVPVDRQASPRPAPAGEVPRPLQRLIGTSLDAIKWKRLAPGMGYVDLPVSGVARGYLRLIKLAASKRLPEHGHRGTELTLVLRGGYRDEHGHYRPGDIDDNDEGVRHQLVIDDDGPCISLVAAEALADYSGLLPRLFQPFTRM